MKRLNVIIVYSPDKSKLLMCHRRKNPYMGMDNLVGGKLEPGEDGLYGAYRELLEETGIADTDIKLTHLMDFTYHMSGVMLEVYAGRLLREAAVFGDENDLFWANAEDNFYNLERFAGEGNIGHMLAQADLYANVLFNQE